MPRETCPFWGSASFGAAYCNDNPEHERGPEHTYKNAAGKVFVLSAVAK